MRKFVMGDIHGNHKGLLQCLERSKFNKEEDLLIQLGDIVDGWSYVYECVEELLTIKSLILIKGNHDDWYYQWIQTGKHPEKWAQGGEGTLKSYTHKLGYGYGKNVGNGWDITDNRGFRTGMHPMDIPSNHRQLFQDQIAYHKDSEDNIFIHGGFNRHFPLSEQLAYTFWWDRDLWSQALSYKGMTNGNLEEKPKFKIKEPCKEIFIGHTSTQFWDSNLPMNAANIWNLDTGAGWYGPLTIMDVDTKEYWQSDLTKELYPNEKGR